MLSTHRVAALPCLLPRPADSLKTPEDHATVRGGDATSCLWCRTKCLGGPWKDASC